MMTRNLRIAKIWNIPIGLHWSWFIVFFLVTYSLAAGVFPENYAGLSEGAYWGLAAVTSVLFFTSVLLHELGHTFVALRYGVPVREINLFIFGGVAVLTKESPSAKAEFWIAIAGPLVSFALAFIFAGLWLASGGFVYLAIPAMFLAGINFMLAAFNLIPGFPLDGGRVLRAVLWWIKGDRHQATRIASAAGRFVAFAFIAYGVFTIFQGNLFGGLWIAFIGWFLQNAAAAALQQSNLEQALRGVRVRDVMSAQFQFVEQDATLQQLFDERLLRGSSREFFVTGNTRPVGLITLTDVAKTPREDWSRTTVESVMKPIEEIITVAPDVSLLDALRQMDKQRVAQLPVVENDALLGLLSRESVLHQIYLRTLLGGGTKEQRRRERQSAPDFALAGGGSK